PPEQQPDEGRVVGLAQVTQGDLELGLTGAAEAEGAEQATQQSLRGLLAGAAGVVLGGALRAALAALAGVLAAGARRRLVAAGAPAEVEQAAAGRRVEDRREDA